MTLRGNRSSGAHRVPGLKPRIAAEEINRWNRIAEQSREQSFVERQPDALEVFEGTQAWWVWIRNNTGNDRERFEVMNLGDPITDFLDDGTADLIFEGEAASSAGTPVILTEPIAGDGELGKAVIHGLAIAKVLAGTGRTASIDATFKLTPGSGSITLLQDPDAANEKLLPVLLGAGGESSSDILAFTPGGGIPAATSLAGVVTFGQATGALAVRQAGANETWGPGGANVELFNKVIGVAIPGNRLVKATLVDGISSSRYVVDLASCSN